MIIKIKIRRFIACYFGRIIEQFFRVKLSFTSFKQPPIIILTPGKVGSSSVYNTLKKKVSNPVFHIHRLSINGIQNSIKEHLESDRKSKPLHLIISEILRKKLQKYDGNIFAITVIREPISREVSSFFQNTEFYKNEIENSELKIDENKALAFISKKLTNGITLELEDWFETEIKKNFNIDVFQNPFDTKKGYVISRKGNYHHLLIKMEALDEKFPSAINELLRQQKINQLQKANIGEQKHYSSSYLTVKNKIKLDQIYLKEIISSNYFQHFYSGEENSIIKKWRKN